MFFRFVVKFNVLADFCESCKKSGVMSKVYAFDSACFYCCATLGTIGFSRVRGEFRSRERKFEQPLARGLFWSRLFFILFAFETV